MIKNPALKFPLVCILLLAFSLPAFAWDDSGHKLVAYIAWQQMTPAARERAVQILLNAPEDSQLNALYPTPPDQDFTTYPPGARSKVAKQRDYFMTAAYWADIVRDRKYEKRSKYHHGTWHYLDTFWQTGANGKVELLPDMENDKENAVTQLFHFDKVLRSDEKDAEKAIALAWVLHIAGDIHQPLHASGRLSPEDPKGGDQGGNTFSLSPPDAKRKENLHWYWDSIVVRTVPRRNDASDADYLLPLGNSFMKKYPLARYRNRLEIGKFDAWQQESFRIASERLYPKTLLRNQMPSAAYNKMAFAIAEEQIAIAGYRLGTWLNQVLGAQSSQSNQSAEQRKEIEQDGTIYVLSEKDAKIVLAAWNSLVGTEQLRDSTVSLHVRYGVLTLHGTVSEKRQKRLAEQVVNKIEGVKAVKNELQVITK